MQLLSRRYLWVVDMLGIVCLSGVVGHSAAKALETALTLTLVPSAAIGPAPSRPARQETAADKSIERIVDRNIFCSTRLAPSPPHRRHRALTLLAIMFAPPPADPRWSLAIVRDDAAATVGPFALGASLGDATIAGIEAARVLLDVGEGELETLDLFRRDQASRTVRVSTDGLADAVTKTGPDRYEVKRAAIDQLITGRSAARWPRVVPEVRDGEGGQPVGLRLLGIGRDGPFAAIGLSDGDVVLEVNGRSIATPDAALAAYTDLRTASRIRVVIERAGQPLRMDYLIR